MADPSYTPDSALVELVAKAIREAPVSIRNGYVDSSDVYSAEARAVLSALADAGRDYAAGRTAAAADIRQKINDWRPQANTSLYALDVLSLAAEIAEGKTDG